MIVCSTVSNSRTLAASGTTISAPWRATGVDPLGGSFEDGSGLHLAQPGDHHSEPRAA